ncbi:ECF transporter S component [Niallia circulans]|uniref:ECF transporter S component n=1 Tax=Niallia circulans TaxID=1397 RepID=UPI00155FB7EE|nr:ECF transporter S component [Niallia circulans]NRG32405.1 ECF transporter S component [Niallia circulans]
MNAKKINVLAIFIAISVIGAFIKIPSFIGSVALDSSPSLIAGALLGGLPLGMLHLFIAVEMFLLVFTFSKIYQTGNSIISILFFVLGNGVILPLPFLYLMGKGFYISMVPVLLIGAVLNGIIAQLLMPRLTVFLKEWRVVKQ